MGVEGQVVVITGAAGGLGREVSRSFHSAGARVVLVGSRTAPIGALARELGKERTATVAADLTVPEEAEGVIGATLARFGSVDALLNLAGGFTGGAPVHETDLVDLDRMLALNLRTALHLSCAAVEPMRRQQSGRIAFVGSRDALHARGGYAFYAIAKAALVRLAEAMAAELAGDGILVNVVIPGAMDTPANRTVQPDADAFRWVPPVDVARALLFLVGEAHSTSGAVLPVLGRP